MNSLKDLIIEAEELEKKASTIQLSTADSSAVGTNWSSQKLSQFADEYHIWYAKSLAILPDDLRDRFRFPYEGNAYLCIKRFIESPTERYNKTESLGNNPWRSEKTTRSVWKYPYDTSFRKPLLSQKQILIEASTRPQKVITFHDAITTIERLARNFHLVAHQLSQRYNNRSTLTIKDEYDVQDLFHALLMPFFEDIRPEEGAPSHAGKNTRIDFLLKREQIVVEIKKTREGLTGKKIGEELTIDKDYYRSHPNCKAFIAFVYDPEKRISNPKGLENDLRQTPDDMFVKVIINQG